MPVQQALVEGTREPRSGPRHHPPGPHVRLQHLAPAQHRRRFRQMQANFQPDRRERLPARSPGSTIPPEGTCQYTVPAGTCPFAAWTEEPAAVTFRASHDVVFFGDTFAHLRRPGSTSSTAARTIWCRQPELDDTSGSGIELGGDNDAQPIGGDPREIVSGNTVADNWSLNVAASMRAASVSGSVTRRAPPSHHNRSTTRPIRPSASDGRVAHRHAPPGQPIGRRQQRHHRQPDLQLSGDGARRRGHLHQRHPGNRPTRPARRPTRSSPTSTSAAEFAKGLNITGSVALIATWSEFAYYDNEGSDYITWRTMSSTRRTRSPRGAVTPAAHPLLRQLLRQPSVGVHPLPRRSTSRSRATTSSPTTPAPAISPASILGGAGLEPGYRRLVAGQAPVGDRNRAPGRARRRRIRRTGERERVPAVLRCCSVRSPRLGDGCLRQLLDCGSPGGGDRAGRHHGAGARLGLRPHLPPTSSSSCRRLRLVELRQGGDWLRLRSSMREKRAVVSGTTLKSRNL